MHWFRLLSIPCKAVAAVNRPVIFGHKWDLGIRTALGANRIIHFARGASVAAAVIALALLDHTAALATNRLVCEAFFGKKLLVADGKYEIFTAVSAF